VLESLFPPLMGLDNAALRSSFSSSSKNPWEGPAWFDSTCFEETTMALEEVVVRRAETAVADEAVRCNECLVPAALATWQKKKL
jgi:hypothetical protein